MVFNIISKLILLLSVAFLSAAAAWGLPSGDMRIVSLSPHITQILYAVGSGDNVVGTPSYTRVSPDIASIGDFMNPSIEKIASLHPSLIIGSNASARPELIHKLRDMGYRVELVDEGSLADIYRSVMMIGGLTGNTYKAKDLLKSMQTGIATLEQSIIKYPRKTVFYQIWDKPLMTIGDGSYLREILIKARLQPITIKSGSYGRISIEEVIRADPDIILIPYDDTMNAEPSALKSAWSRYPNLRAVRDGHVYLVNSENLHIPGPRLPDGLRDIIGVVWGTK